MVDAKQRIVALQGHFLNPVEVWSSFFVEEKGRKERKGTTSLGGFLQVSASASNEDSQVLAHKESMEFPEKFWGEAAQAIKWTQQPSKVLDRSNPPFYRWFVDGTLNACFNAVDKHVDEGHGARVAVYYDSPLTNSARAITFAELQDKVFSRLVFGDLQLHWIDE